jgi:hypothetical protein
MLPDLRFLRAIEPPIDDCVVQEAERRQRISVNSGFGEGKGQVAIDTAGNVFLVWWSENGGHGRRWLGGRCRSLRSA